MQEVVNKYKNPSGVRYTRGLFFELTGEDKSSVIYTLKDTEHKGYPSLKELYLREGDTTEYRFAKKYLDGYEHWKILTESEWFKPFVSLWREELRLKKEAEYIAKLEEIAATDGKDRTSAIRILLNRAETGSRSVKRGRPLSGYPEEVKSSVQASKAQEILNDLKRLENGRTPDGSPDLRLQA